MTTSFHTIRGPQARGSTTRRAATALAATALAAFVTAAPAFARQDPGEGMSIPSFAEQHRGVGATTEENRTYQSDIERQNADDMGRKNATTPGPEVITLDDNAVEYLQIGLGVLGGMALVGGAVAAGSARRHHHGHAHPA